MPIKNYEIRIRDDRYDAVSFGSGKENLVMIPGLGDGITTVKGRALVGSVLYRRYCKKYRVTLISRKNRLDEHATTESMAQDQYLAMQALGIEKAHIIGVSMGGMIAQHLAADHPEAVDRLILVVTTPETGETAKENLDRWIGFARMKAYLGLMIDINEKAHPEKYLKKLRPLYPYLGSAAKKMDIERFCIQAAACRDHNALEKLNRIQAPTLIIGGGQDRTLGEEGSHQLNRAIGDSRIKIYIDQGHALYEDDPDFHRTCLSFLEEPALPEAE